MALVGDRTFVGFGFGPIQAGLFLHEAFRSGAFRRLVVAEVMPEAVAALRRAGGLCSVNIAYSNRVEAAAIGPVEAEMPSEAEDRARLVAAVETAMEIATAVPSVRFYKTEGPGSIHRIIADGLTARVRGGGGPVVIYTAENHNHAAEILREAVLEEVPAACRDGVVRRSCFVNTMIGKMSCSIADPAEVRARGLQPATRGEERAFLVESFNRILISTVSFPGEATAFRRGISVFLEKPDLLPFEEAKLYGHNATHATAGYLAAIAGKRRIAELRNMPGTMAFLRAAFVEESGAAMVKRHAGIDPLFTAEGYSAYSDDLLARMTNPHLGDTTERVNRDVRRKLGWDDRLFGTMRIALREGIRPRRYGVGAAAALIAFRKELSDPGHPIEPILEEIWGAGPPASEVETVLPHVRRGREILSAWVSAGFPELERLMQESGESRNM
jgi:mannitol-1-phosphate 5-dehydrogenase